MFASPEQVLMRQLLATPQVAIHVGLRVFPLLAPTSSALPFVTYQRTGVSREQTLSGAMGVPSVSVQFAAYAETYLQSRTIADAVRASLDAYAGSAFGTIVGQTQLTSESDDFVQLQGGDVPPVYQTTLTLDTQWSE